MNDINSSGAGEKKLSRDEVKKILLIKNMQSLPEEVIIKFIESKGKLIRTKNGKLKIVQKI
jgi:hypothetical protein